MSKSLIEVYDECVNETSTKVQADQRFLCLAKQHDSDITMNKVMEICKYTYEPENDESEEDSRKKSLNLSQKFRNNVLIPVRQYIAQDVVKAEFPAEEIFSRQATDDMKEVRKEIDKYLPKTTRITKTKNSDHLNGVFK